MMWPALSSTKPEPSAFCFSVWGRPKSKGSFVRTTCVEVTWTTAGASRRKISLIVIALPGLTGLNDVGELPAKAGSIWRTVVVLPPTPSAEAPASEIAPPNRPAARSAAMGSNCLRERTVGL